MLFAVLVHLSLCHGDVPCVVTKMGAKCDGKTDDTQAIQQALESCQTTVIPQGAVCLSQPLAVTQRKNVRFIIAGSLKAGAKWNQTTFVVFSQCTNITLSGNGTGRIDGSGAQWWTGSNKTPGRPEMLNILECHGVVVQDLFLLNAAKYHMFVTGSDYVIANVKIRSPPYTVAPNTDGIDVAANNVLVTGADVKNGDDSICMKTGSSNVVVENSLVQQGNGFVIGTGNNAARFTVSCMCWCSLCFCCLVFVLALVVLPMW